MWNLGLPGCKLSSFQQVIAACVEFPRSKPLFFIVAGTGFGGLPMALELTWGGMRARPDEVLSGLDCVVKNDLLRISYNSYFVPLGEWLT